MDVKVGLALGSGGVRGFAHLGVLKVLEAHHIPIDYLSGSSMGSVIAALYASGIELKYLIRLAEHMDRSLFIDYTFPRMGLIRGEKIYELIRLLTKDQALEDLFIPTRIVATDLKQGEPYVFHSGPAALAVRASIAIPGIFEPVELGERLLVDGGVIERVPAGVVHDMGADMVIGVDVSHSTTPKNVRNIYEVILQTIDIMESQIFQHRFRRDDVFIRPDVGQYSPLSFQNIEDIIRAGEVAALEVIETIVDRLERDQAQTVASFLTPDHDGLE